MKIFKFLIIICLTVFYSCTDKFEDLNTDKKHPSSIPAEPLFTNAAVNLADLMNDCSVNTNVFRLYAQYWAQTTYPDESQYNMVTRENPDYIFNTIYRDVLRDLKECTTILNKENITNNIAESERKNKNNLISILEVFSYAHLVDVFGDVPYTEALSDATNTPVYDKGADIYASLLIKLDAAINGLDAGFGSFGSADPYYGGDVAKWKTFANSLKLRMGMRLADVDDAKAKAIVESCFANVMQNNGESCLITYFGAAPNTNPVYENLVLSGRNDFLGANTIIDKMNAMNDPRRSAYFQLSNDNIYEGGIYGSDNSFSEFSKIGLEFYTPTLSGNMMDYAEVQFLLAEAAARGYSVGGTVESYYNNGIKASINFWGGSDADASAYTAQASVAYSTAAGDWKQKIGTQKWLALYNNGSEGWTTWRIFDFTGFNTPATLTYDDIPKRMIFPINEATLNGANLKLAAARYLGDSPKAKIFWDKF
ncbi:MAG: SusD/RagB family nutrient-binding outer membrane lipoprotein [Saprospiraceae bacterium]